MCVSNTLLLFVGYRFPGSGSFHTIIDTCGLGLYQKYNPRIVPSFFHEVQRVLATDGVFYGREGFKFVSGTIIHDEP